MPIPGIKGEIVMFRGHGPFEPIEYAHYVPYDPRKRHRNPGRIKKFFQALLDVILMTSALASM